MLLQLLQNGGSLACMLCTDPSTCVVDHLLPPGRFPRHTTFATLTDLGDTDNPIPLPNVTSNVLKKVSIGARLTLT